MMSGSCIFGDYSSGGKTMKTCSFITDLYREILRFEFTIIKVVNVNVALTHQSDDIIVSEACSVLSLIVWRQIMIYL